MIITPDSLRSMYTAFSTAYQMGFSGAPSAYKNIAMEVPSSAREETYAWMGQIPKLREWVGDRVIKSIQAHAYTVTNRDFEQTISVPRNDIADDRIGIFGPLFSEMGKAAGEMPDELIFTLLAAGFSTECYDGQFFFDTDHPVKFQDEAPITVSNFQAGAGAPWFLLDTSRAMKPLIYQSREPFDRLVKKDQAEDDNVFFKKQYIYGCAGRANAGFGLWQLAYASKAPLTAENYEAARVAMMTLRGEGGRLLGVKPDTLVVPPILEGAAMRLLNNGTRLISENGGVELDAPIAVQNEWAGTAKPIISHWLAA